MKLFHCYEAEGGKWLEQWKPYNAPSPTEGRTGSGSLNRFGQKAKMLLSGTTSDDVWGLDVAILSEWMGLMLLPQKWS